MRPLHLVPKVALKSLCLLCQVQIQNAADCLKLATDIVLLFLPRYYAFFVFAYMLSNRRDCHKRPHMLNNAFTRLKKWSTDMRGFFSYNSINRRQSGSSRAEIQRCYPVPIQSQPPGSPYARQGEVFYLCLNRFLLFPSPLHLYAPAAVLIQHVSRLCYLKCLFSLGLTKKKKRERQEPFPL